MSVGRVFCPNARLQWRKAVFFFFPHHARHSFIYKLMSYVTSIIQKATYEVEHGGENLRTVNLPFSLWLYGRYDASIVLLDVAVDQAVPNQLNL